MTPTNEPKTLEEFVENQCGMITPKILEILEPHREFVENALSNFESEESCDWSQFTELLWKYLPEIKDKHFRP
jgi:hypothetical protein